MSATQLPPFARFLPASGIRKVFDRAQELKRQGKEIYHLDVGRPDYPMLAGVAEAAKNAIDQGHNHYIPNRGVPELRAALCDDVFEKTGRRFNPDTEMIVTIGASEALANALLTLTGPGDEVIVHEPAWNHYHTCIEMAGAKVVPIQLRAEDGFLIDPELFAKAITPRTRMMLINTPSNPTGAVQHKEALQAVAKLALKHGIYVFADEPYEYFVFRGEHYSIARDMGDSELLIYANTFSKSFAMSGWRIGWLAASAKVSDAMMRMHQHLVVCGSAFSQIGALAALKSPQRAAYHKAMRDEFQRRYQVWIDTLTGVDGLKLVPPAGSFFVFPEVTYRNMNGMEFSTWLLENHGVALVPGEIFGPSYKNHVRISFGGSLETQQKAAQRIKAALG